MFRGFQRRVLGFFGDSLGNLKFFFFLVNYRTVVSHREALWKWVDFHLIIGVYRVYFYDRYWDENLQLVQVRCNHYIPIIVLFHSTDNETSTEVHQ